MVHKPCIAIDAGFFIEALNGFPKAYVNFALETIGIEGILTLLKDEPNRSCYFKEILAYHDSNEIYYFESISKGSVTFEKLGNDTVENGLIYGISIFQMVKQKR